MSALATRGIPGLMAGLILLPAGAMCAQEAKRVKVTVVVILASDRSGEVDPRLKCIADEVRKHNPSLRGFTLASMAWKSLPADQKTLFPLLENQTAEVVVHTCADKHNRVCLGLKPPWQGLIVYRIVCGKFLPVVTRYQTRERIPTPVVVQALGAMRNPRFGPLLGATLLAAGRTRERLILAVRVQPCSGK